MDDYEEEVEENKGAVEDMEMDNDLDNAPAYNYSSLEDLNKLIASDADLDHNFESTLL